MFKVNNRNTRTSREKCSKLTIKTPVRHQWRRSGVSIVNFEHISYLSVSIGKFDQVNAGWVRTQGRKDNNGSPSSVIFEKFEQFLLRNVLLPFLKIFVKSQQKRYQ